MPETPEQKARREIDADLAAAGWVVQGRDEIYITAGRGVAVLELPMPWRLTIAGDRTRNARDHPHA